MSTVNPPTVASLMQQLAWEYLRYEEAMKNDHTLEVKKAIRLKIKELEQQIEELKCRANGN